jgi:hypothetical protein
MRKTLRAAVFVLALCAPAFAGDIPCPSVTQPLSTTAETEEMADSEAADSFTETILSVLGSVLALL